MAAVPIGIAAYMKEKKAHPQAQIVQQGTANNQALQQQAEADQPNPSAQQQAEPAPQPRLRGAVIARLAMIGLTSPYYALQDGTSGLIGLVILFVGIQIAWRITASKPLDINGPFENSTPASA